MALKKDIIKTLKLIAEYSEYLDLNRFKINAYLNASRILNDLEIDLVDYIKSNKISEIKGIGKGIQALITEIYETGKSSELDELSKQVPSGAKELIVINGLGIKKVKLLLSEYDIKNIDDLQNLITNGKLSNIKGFGEKSLNKILEEIKMIKSYKGFLRYDSAYNLSILISEKLNELEFVEYFEISGDLRIVKEILSEVIFIVKISNNPLFNNLSNYFENFEIKENLILINDFEIPVILKIIDNRSEFVKELFVTSSSEDFISEFDLNFEFKDEEDIFNNNHKQFIPSELRDIRYESSLLYLNNKKIELTDFKGLIHFHTNFSDGGNTLYEMVEKAKKNNFEYAVVCDHSQSAVYAGGLKPEKVFEQQNLIDKLSDETFKIFSGIESDILRNGELDYTESILQTFDFIVASVHSITNLSEEEMTNRVIKAIENPFTDVIAHPTGRLLLKRNEYPIDVKKIIDACVANNVAIEINSNPQRLDLDWRYYSYGIDKGVLFAINPDAHSLKGIDDLKYGITFANKRRIPTDRIINCFSLNKFKEFINRKVKRQ